MRASNPPLSAKFVDKAEAALVAAVELYNKPSYREETFALLAINAWELLLKAELLKQGANDPKANRVYEPHRTKSGKLSKKLYLKRNRAGSPLTLSLPACVVALDKDPATRLNPEIKANLEALIAVRDNAAQYIHASRFSRQAGRWRCRSCGRCVSRVNKVRARKPVCNSARKP